MSTPGDLVGLYPRAFRDRWGADARDDADAGGWRTAPNLLAGIAAMWVRPVVWPAGSAAERRHRAAVLGFVVAFAGWLVGHAFVENAIPHRIAQSPVLRACDVLIMAGLVLLTPWPRLTFGLVRQAVRRLGVPALAGLLIVAWANSAWVDLGGATGEPVSRHLVLAAWWVTLAAGSVQICRFVAGLGTAAAEPPPLHRLRAGIWALVIAFAAGGAVVAAPALAGGSFAFAAGLLGAMLITLTALGVFTLRDLAELRPAQDGPGG